MPNGVGSKKTSVEKMVLSDIKLCKKRAFEGAKLAKFYRKLNSEDGLAKININQK